MLQRVSSAVHTQGQKGAIKEQTVAHVAIQTQGEIQI